MSTEPIILSDGVCNFCNGAVNFVIKRDRKNLIRFAPLQSEAAHQLLIDYDMPVNDMKSFIFIENGKAYRQSTAALKVCRYLKGLWPLVYGLVIVPAVIRDGIYEWIATNRYKWFGKRDQCMVPTAELQCKFLNQIPYVK